MAETTNKPSDEEEEDYMGDLSQFLPPETTAPSKSSVKVSANNTQLSQPSVKKPKTLNWQEQRKLKRENRQEEEDRNTLASLESAIPQSNIGFKLLKQMGYTPGSTLGKEDSGLAEPVGLEIRRTRAGIGQEDSRKEKRKREEERMEWERGKEEALMEDFGCRHKEQWRSRRIVVNYHKAKAALEQLENKELVAEAEKDEEDTENEEEEEEIIAEECMNQWKHSYPIAQEQMKMTIERLFQITRICSTTQLPEEDATLPKLGNVEGSNNQDLSVNVDTSASSHNVLHGNTISAMDVDVTVNIPFALVDEIAEASPAPEDGLQLGDQIVKFGNVESGDDLLPKLASEALSNQDREIPVVVLRQGALINLTVTPRAWQGRGLLDVISESYDHLHGALMNSDASVRPARRQCPSRCVLNIHSPLCQSIGVKGWEITHSTSTVQKSKTIFHIASTPRRLYSFHRRIVSSSSPPSLRREDCLRSIVTSSHHLLRRSYAQKTVYVPSSNRPFVSTSLSSKWAKNNVAQKKTGKRKRDEYHVKEETPKTNTCTNVDMRHVNYRSNMTGLVKLMKTTKFTKAQLRCLQQTPFWNLFDALRNNQIDLDKCMKYDDVVVHVLQMYQASEDAFYIGQKKMKIHNSDIKLIFGVDYGSKPMDMSYGAKPKTGIVNRRCKNVSRLTSKWIRTLLTEALKGKKKDDNEEVARLVCMYACQKLFFSTSGETIGWGYYAHMVPLESMQEYDWAKQIRTMLTSSISQNDKNPAKVTGCVMLLMYWLCEHTTVLQPHRPNAFPRCVKWDLTALQKKMKTTSLADLGFNEVNAGELFAIPTELQKFKRKTLKVEPEIYEPARTSPNLSDIKGEQHSGSNSYFSGDGVDLKDSNEDIHIPFSSQHYDRAIVIPNTNQPDIIDVLIQENRKAWGVIRQWEAKYKHLQFSWELRARVIADLEHKLFNQSSLPNVNIEMKKCMEQKDKEIKRLTQLVIDLECDKTILQDLYDDQSVHIVTQAMSERQPPSPMQHNISPPSRVKRIKEKDRKEHRLPDFQYPDLPGQKQPHPIEMVEDVEKHPPAKQPKKIILYQQVQSDELLVWKGDSKATHVYFDDIVNLIKEESIHSNLIDAYAELLHEQQEVVNPTSDEASLIFTSMCLKVIREYHPRKRSKHIDAHVKNYQGERYLLFPLHHEYHWTIVVYDAKDNLWKHYNSLCPRTSIHDPHIDQAQEIRKYIEHVVSVIGESSPLYTKLAGQNPAQPTKSVDVCPQQEWTADLQYVTSCGRTYIMKKLWAASVVQNGVDYEIC
ncbi:unnamed protein product [Camellia sinensis]